jgi:acyl-CoA synthetase (AMP-forming)/AMP-acid ligase II
MGLSPAFVSSALRALEKHRRMLSALDNELRAIMDRLTAPGGPFELGLADRGGQRLPVFRHAPPTLAAFFAHYCIEHRDREFLVDGEVRLRFGEAHALARRVAAGLVASHGVRPGDRVGIAASNSANWIIAYMGVSLAGGCATLLNAWWTEEELAAAIALAECDLVLADPVRAALLERPDLRARIVTFDHGAPEAGLAGLAASNDNAVILPEPRGEDLATMLFTSGSTGLPRAAVSDHRAVVNAAMNVAAQCRMLALQLAGEGRPTPGQETALLCVPLFHATGEIVVLLASFVTGRRVAILPHWDALEAMRLIERERVGFFTGVPLMSHEIATHSERGRYDLSSCACFVVGGSAQPAAHVHQLREALYPAFPVQGYGLTETNGLGCTNFAGNYLARPDSTGPASFPLVEVMVVGPTGEALPPGMVGEIAVRSIANFRGYWRNPEASAAVLRPDGFVLTGDLGAMDEDGYLRIIDRLKDIIIRGGENIAAAEVERAIYSHPHIAEASVFGLPDEFYGEVPVAVYHVRAGQPLDARELQRHLAERIAAFKIPVRFWRQDGALPRLGSEKVDKAALRERYAPLWTAAKG